MDKEKKTRPGINIQWPWSQLIIEGKKTVETRTYDIPEKHRGVELLLIETPGPRGKKEAGIEKARIIGSVTFVETYKYKTKKQWSSERDKHLVDNSDKFYGWNKKKEKWGWEVSNFTKHKDPVIAKSPRGIIFCKI